MAATERVWAGLCTACEGCVLHVGHAGECKIGEVEEEEYEMERIIAQRTTKKGTQYLVKWVGWPAEDSTWESDQAFKDFGCMDTLQVQSHPTRTQAADDRTPHLSPATRCIGLD